MFLLLKLFHPLYLGYIINVFCFPLVKVQETFSLQYICDKESTKVTGFDKSLGVKPSFFRNKNDPIQKQNKTGRDIFPLSRVNLIDFTFLSL